MTTISPPKKLTAFAERISRAGDTLALGWRNLAYGLLLGLPIPLFLLALTLGRYQIGVVDVACLVGVEVLPAARADCLDAVPLAAGVPFGADPCTARGAAHGLQAWTGDAPVDSEAGAAPLAGEGDCGAVCPSGPHGHTAVNRNRTRQVRQAGTIRLVLAPLGP